MSNILKFASMFLIFSFIFLLIPADVFADVSKSPATGGSSIQANTAGGEYTILSGPTIREGSNRDIGTGTIIINSPSGFEFNIGASVTATVEKITGSKSCFSFSSETAVPTSNSITFTVSSQDGTGGNPQTKCKVTFSNIQVRPTSSTESASGDLTISGTSSISGITETTSFGNLHSIASASGTVNLDAYLINSSTCAEAALGGLASSAYLNMTGSPNSGWSGTDLNPGSYPGKSLGQYTLNSVSISNAIYRSANNCGYTNGINNSLYANPQNLSSGNTITFRGVFEETPGQTESIPSGGGGGPSGGVRPTQARFSGQAYPGSKIEVLYRSNLDDTYKSTPTAFYSMSPEGVFETSLTALLGGNYLFALRTEDKDGRKTGVWSFKIDFLSTNDLVAENLFVPPTIGFSRNAIRKGDFITIQGYAAPSSVMDIEIDGISIGQDITAGYDGFYKALSGTADLSLGTHSARARQKNSVGKLSDYSQQTTFSVSKLFFPQTDLNSDSIIDIKDWSIFLSKWSSNDPAVRARLDFNGDGRVNLSDFSLFVRTLNNK